MTNNNDAFAEHGEQMSVEDEKKIGEVGFVEDKFVND